MRGNYNLGNCDITDPNFAGLGPTAPGGGAPPGTFSFKVGAGQLWRMRTQLNIVTHVVADGIGVCTVASFMTTPSVSYTILAARVRFAANLTATGGPTTISLLLRIGAIVIVNASSCGAFSAGTYDITNPSNRNAFGMGSDPGAGSGGVGGESYLQDGQHFFAYGSNAFSQEVALDIQAAPAGWVLTNGTIAVELLGAMGN